MQIFRLEPRVAGLEQPENEMPDAADTTEEKAEKFRNVTRMYSTKKNIRKVCLFEWKVDSVVLFKENKRFPTIYIKSCIKPYIIK